MSLLQDMKDLTSQWDQIIKEGQKNPSKENEEKRKDLEFQLFMLQNKQETEILNLTDRLNYYKEEYHKGNSKISNDEWDKLYFELYYLEKQSGIILSNSPTRALQHQSKHIDSLQEIECPYKKNILQDQTNNLNNVLAFCNNKDVAVMVDPIGVTCFLQYDNGILKSVIAQLDNNTTAIGYDITDFALAISPIIPRKIEYQEQLIIEGKITCLKKEFKGKFLNIYKTPMNFILNSFTVSDVALFGNYHLTFLATDVISGFNDIDSYRIKMQSLGKLGFLFPPDMLINNNNFDLSLLKLLQINAEKREIFFSNIKFKKNNFDKNDFQQEIIYNYLPFQYQRTLQKIVWSFNKDSEDILIPFAIIEPIFFNSQKFRHISLPLQQSVLKQSFGEQPYKGQKIFLYTVNTLSPQLNYADLQNPSFDPEEYFLLTPTHCPFCGTEIIIQNDNDKHLEYDDPDFTYLKCPNSSCPGKFLNKIKHFMGIDGLNIKGFSNDIIEWLILKKQWITCYQDIYTLKKYQKEWSLEEGYNNEIVKNLLIAIEDSKKCTLADFIASFSIPLITKNDAMLLAEYFQTYENFIKAIFDYSIDFDNNLFIEIPGLTQEQIQNILDFDYTTFDYLWKVFKYGEEIPYEQNYFYMPLRQKKYVVIGPVKYFDSVEWLCGYIHGEGGAVFTTVTEEVDYVINNDPDSDCSENIAARELGIPIITEQEFLSNIY